MPMYEYKCLSCGHLTTVLQKSAATKKTPPCEACGSNQTEKLFSTFATHNALPDNCKSCQSPNSCPGGTCPYSS